MGRLKIGITCYPTYGGSGVVGTELGKHLAARGHQVHFITYDVPFRLAGYRENIFFHEVEVPTYPLFLYPPYLLALANKLAEVARYEGLDVLHAHYAIPHAASAYLAREMLGGGRPRVLTTLHGTDITLVGSQPSFADIVAFSINRSDGVTAVSEALRRQTLETFAVEKDIHVIYNFVDPDEFRRRPDQALLNRFAPGGERVLIHVSNFRPTKRVDRVVEIFARVARRVPAVLLMVGDGPDLGLARRLGHEHGLAERLFFLGKQDQVVPLLSIADVLLLPSAHESFGLVALEAMACEVPVVASRLGGLPELVADGQCGYLVPQDDLEAMAERAVALLQDADLRRSMGRAGRQRAVEHFNAERVVAQYEDLYRSLVDA